MLRNQILSISPTPTGSLQDTARHMVDFPRGDHPYDAHAGYDPKNHIERRNQEPGGAGMGSSMQSTPIALPDADGQAQPDQFATTPTSQGTSRDVGPHSLGAQREFTRQYAVALPSRNGPIEQCHHQRGIHKIYWRVPTLSEGECATILASSCSSAEADRIASLTRTIFVVDPSRKLRTTLSYPAHVGAPPYGAGGRACEFEQRALRPGSGTLCTLHPLVALAYVFCLDNSFDSSPHVERAALDQRCSAAMRWPWREGVIFVARRCS